MGRPASLNGAGMLVAQVLRSSELRRCFQSRPPPSRHWSRKQSSSAIIAMASSQIPFPGLSGLRIGRVWDLIPELCRAHHQGREKRGDEVSPSKTAPICGWGSFRADQAAPFHQSFRLCDPVLPRKDRSRDQTC